MNVKRSLKSPGHSLAAGRVYQTVSPACHEQGGRPEVAGRPKAGGGPDLGQDVLGARGREHAPAASQLDVASMEDARRSEHVELPSYRVHARGPPGQPDRCPQPKAAAEPGVGAARVDGYHLGEVVGEAARPLQRRHASHRQAENPLGARIQGQPPAPEVEHDRLQRPGASPMPLGPESG